MPATGKDDPEMSYRRGFQQGAIETFRAVKPFLDTTTRDVVGAWIEQDIGRWRFNAMLDHPPTWRLANLNVPKSNWLED